ncbi:MAG: glycosyltransferase family 2 protein [Hyphomicrobiaceae bacterium]
MSAEPTFSLIVATYGRAEVLRPLVASLAAQTYRSFEVIVADQNADGRVIAELAPLQAAGRIAAHLKLDKPNLSAARNAGIAVARGRFIAFPDDDCWYEADTLARAAGHLLPAEGPDGLAARWSEARPEPGDDDPAPIRPEAIRKFRGGNLASITLFLKRDRVTMVGGFDERIGVGRWYGAAEETDLVMALIARGARIRHASDVIVHHSVTDPSVQVAKPGLERARARGTGALYAKHRLPAWVVARGVLSPLLVAPGPRLVAGAARSLGRLEGMIRWRLAEESKHPRSPATRNEPHPSQET